MDVLDIVVDRSILETFLAIIKNLLKHCDVFKGQLTPRIAMSVHVRDVQVFLHLLKHLG